MAKTKNLQNEETYFNIQYLVSQNVYINSQSFDIVGWAAGRASGM